VGSTRTAHETYQHYFRVLDSSISRAPFSRSELLLLCALVTLVGSSSWERIARGLSAVYGHRRTGTQLRTKWLRIEQSVHDEFRDMRLVLAQPADMLDFLEKRGVSSEEVHTALQACHEDRVQGMPVAFVPPGMSTREEESPLLTPHEEREALLVNGGAGRSWMPPVDLSLDLNLDLHVEVDVEVDDNVVEMKQNDWEQVVDIDYSQAHEFQFVRTMLPNVALHLFGTNNASFSSSNSSSNSSSAAELAGYPFAKTHGMSSSHQACGLRV
jgi:hypothetical protein